MSAGTADIHEAIYAAWTAAGLDAKFHALWDTTAVTANHPVLSDQKAGPKQPFPYCVMETQNPRVRARMSGPTGFKNEFRDVQITFNVHAKKLSTDVRSAKAIAVYLAGEVMKVFGGHPTTARSPLTLTNGNVLNTQYVNDFGVAEELYMWRWVVVVNFTVDVPTAV